jgi:catechol 2,3-dioxygenase-like lactoylglutathione lyase family enzyme
MIRQLAHNCFFSDNVKGMRYFYEDILGLKIKFTLKNQAGEDFGFYFDCGNGTFIELFDKVMANAEWGGDNIKLQHGTHFRHFCLEVVGLETFKKQIEDKKWNISIISIGKDNARQAWISDADGNLIELMEYTYSSLQLQK